MEVKESTSSAYKTITLFTTFPIQSQKRTKMAMESHSNPSQAFVIIINPQEHRLRIPSEFMRRHGRNLRDHVSLKVPGGSVRKVGLLRSNGETWIHTGCQEFKDFYSIGSGHLLLFTYDRNLHFDVRIFDINGMEIDYPHDNSNDDDKGINLNRMSARVPETDDVESESHDSFVLLNEISTCRKTQYDSSATQERKKNMSNDHYLRNLKMLNEISVTSPAEKPSKGIPSFSTSAKKISAKKASFPMVKPAFTNMESWGVEVKCGEVLKVRPGDGMVLHLSHACLCELYMRIALPSVCLFVNIDGIKFVLGTLLTNKLPQQQFDVVFDTDFELTHNSSNGSVYFYGYRTHNLFEKDELPEGDSNETESEEDIPLTLENNGKPESKSKQEKAGDVEKFKAAREKESGSGKHKVTIVEPSKDVNPEEDDESDDEDDSEDEDEDDSGDESDEETPKENVSGKPKVTILEPSKGVAPDEDGKSDDEESISHDDNEDEEDSDDESDEETLKEVQPSKNRVAESALKKPISDMKTKITVGKKVSTHIASSHPTKQAGKTPVNKPNQQNRGRSHSCKSCSRTFGSHRLW